MAIMRVTRAERKVVEALRSDTTRHLLIQTLDTKLEEMNEAAQVMAGDYTLPFLQFVDVYNDHITDAARLELLKEAVEHVDNGL